MYIEFSVVYIGLRIKETKEVYEGEVTELTPCETENPLGGELIFTVIGDMRQELS